jgi:DNA-binding CsgD family transcriptional regulator
MMSGSVERLRSDMVALTDRSHDLRDLTLGTARILRRAVSFDGICMLAFDPATLLPAREVVERGLPPTATPRMAEIEVGEADFNKFPDLARSTPRAASLSVATGGSLDCSRRHREVKGPHGFGDELRAALVGDAATWGGMTLLRRAGDADFTPEEARVVDALSAEIAEGVRRAILREALVGSAGREERAAGVVLVEEDHSAAVNPAGERWLAELRDREVDGAGLPSIVVAVASRARRAAAGDDVADAWARVRTRTGAWLVVHGSMLGSGSGGPSVVILEPAGTTALAPLVADAYELTGRERAVVQLVAEGLGTDAIGATLHLSAWTVQDHLKSIFEKTGTRTRGQLVARLYFEHHPPRLTDAI